MLELASLGPGPHAGMLFADLGARVVRVERPDGAGLPIDLPDAADATLRGRERLTADLRTPDGLRRVLAVLDEADVLIEGLRPGVAERLGIGPEIALERNPRLVYGRITGWGQDGPWAQRAGHDINYLGLTGALEAIGPPERPALPLNLVADFGAGSMLLVVGVLAALLERERTGVGQVVDAAMVDGVAMLSQLILSLRNAGEWSGRRADNLLDGGAPFYDVYRCADGKFVAVGALEPQFYAALLEGLEVDASMLPAQYDRTGWPRIRAVFTERFATRSRADWCALFEHRDACLTPVLSFSEAPGHPHLSARATFLHGVAGPQAAPAPRFSQPVNDTH